MSHSVRRIMAYVATAVAVLALLALVQPGAAFVGWYFCITFWMLAGFDFYRSQVQEPAMKASFAYEDRFIGYLFSAPFVWPIRLYELARASRTA